MTGAAGFIGYHTCKALSNTPETFVLGLDNFNSRYNASFKSYRQTLLSSCCNITIVKGDIRDAALLWKLFSCYRFTQVVHLAASAGVRQSILEPVGYVSDNVEGTVVLLEAMRKQPAPRPSLVYASSSSVYGLRRDLNSSTHDPCCSAPTSHGPAPGGSQVDPAPASGNYNNTAYLVFMGMQPSRECSVACGEPTSVYAATKVATEKVVAVYVHQYGMSAAGKEFLRLQLPAPATPISPNHKPGCTYPLLHYANTPLTYVCTFLTQASDFLQYMDLWGGQIWR